MEQHEDTRKPLGSTKTSIESSKDEVIVDNGGTTNSGEDEAPVASVPYIAKGDCKRTPALTLVDKYTKLDEEEIHQLNGATAQPSECIFKESSNVDYGETTKRGNEKAPVATAPYIEKGGRVGTHSLTILDAETKLDEGEIHQWIEATEQLSECKFKGTIEEKSSIDGDASGDENLGESFIGKTSCDRKQGNNGEVEKCPLQKENCNTIPSFGLKNKKNKETDCANTTEADGSTTVTHTLEDNWNCAQRSELRDIVEQGRNGDNESEVPTNVLRQTGISSETATPLPNVLTVAVQPSDAPNDRNEEGPIDMPPIHDAVTYRGLSAEENREAEALWSLQGHADHSFCQVCQRSARNVVIRPCGHLLFCWSCVRGIYTCWRCDSAILQIISIYLD